MATRTHSPFETLARVIEHLDGDGRSVRRTEASESGEDGLLHATVAVSVGTGDAGAGLEPADATVDGGLEVTFRAPAFPDPAAALSPEYPQVSATPTDVVRDGDAVLVTLQLTIGGADGSAGEGGVTERDEGGAAATAAFGAQPAGADAGDAGAEGDNGPGGAGSRVEAAAGADADVGATSPLAAVRDESVPAYDDTPYLRRLYETCGTFAEMSDRIEMDVSAETVRRYMTDAGVHTPASYETTNRTSESSGGTASDAASDASVATESTAGTESVTAPEPEPDAESAGESAGESAPATSRGSLADGDRGPPASLPDEQLVTDGIGLPEALTLHDVVDAVVDARTVHEVQREVGLDYNRTRQLLCQLNLLDLVVGRVSGDSDRTVTVDVVADRIRESAPDAV